MDVITSVQNGAVKAARALKDKKRRDETGLFLAEGVNLVKDMPEWTAVREVFCTPERASEVQKSLACSRARVYYVCESVLKSLSDTVSPYGIAVVCEKPEREFKLPAGDALLLDGVSDPGNLGTILRTAAAKGFNDVYLLNTADAYSPKTVRASLGAIFRIRITEVSRDEALELVLSTQSAALNMDGEDITSTVIQSPVLFIVGGEAHGISQEINVAAKRVLSLPMKNGIESLNAAVAAAVAMYSTKQEVI